MQWALMAGQFLAPGTVAVALVVDVPEPALRWGLVGGGVCVLIAVVGELRKSL